MTEFDPCENCGGKCERDNSCQRVLTSHPPQMLTICVKCGIKCWKPTLFKIQEMDNLQEKTNFSSEKPRIINAEWINNLIQSLKD